MSCAARPDQPRLGGHDLLRERLGRRADRTQQALVLRVVRQQRQQQHRQQQLLSGRLVPASSTIASRTTPSGSRGRRPQEQDYRLRRLRHEVHRSRVHVGHRCRNSLQDAHPEVEVHRGREMDVHGEQQGPARSRVPLGLNNTKARGSSLASSRCRVRLRGMRTRRAWTSIAARRRSRRSAGARGDGDTQLLSAALSYVAGAHTFKSGVQWASGVLSDSRRRQKRRPDPALSGWRPGFGAWSRTRR